MTDSAFRNRRSSLKLLTSLAAFASAAPLHTVLAQTSAKTFRVGWQKGSNIALLRARMASMGKSAACMNNASSLFSIPEMLLACPVLRDPE